MKALTVIFTFFFALSAYTQCNGTEPQINLGNDTVICANQTLDLFAPAGFDYYSWSTGAMSNTITVTTPGEYSVNAGVVGANLVLNPDFQGGTTAASNNFTTSYTPGTGGSFGLLSNPGTYAISTSPSLVHTNFSNCGDHTTGTGNMLIANGSSTPNTNVWSQTITVLPNTNYLFAFWQMNALNATEVSNLQLFINNVPISSIVPTSTTGCVWQENSGMWNSLGATQAILSIVNQSTLSSGNDFAIDDIYFAQICVISDTINVEYDTLQVNAGTDLLFCANESDDLVATANMPGTTFNWSSGETTATITPTASGIYTVIGTSVNGCTDTDEANVSITAMDWDIDQVLSGPTNCGENNGYVSVITSGTFQDPPMYTWTGPGAGNPNFINASVWDNLPVGWYFIEIESNGCYRYDSVQVIPSDPPIAAVSATPTSGIYPLNVNLQNSSQNANTYFWYFGNGNTATVNDLSSQNQTYDTTGVYTVMLIASNGNCADTAYVTITVNEPPVIPPVVPVSLETSNVFTPNGDEVNDVYSFKMENIVELELTILNRWGQVVFEGDELTPEWDGKHLSGTEAEDGVYFYIFKAVGAQDEPFEGQGFIHLIR